MRRDDEKSLNSYKMSDILKRANLLNEKSGKKKGFQFILAA
jgi:hypothetical protein